MSFLGNKQTATYHDTTYAQDRCAIDKMPEDKLVKSLVEFNGAVEGRSARRDESIPTWKICAHCKRARDKALNPEPVAEPVVKAPKEKKESAKDRKAREAAEAAAAVEPPVVDIAVPVAEAPPEPVDLFAEDAPVVEIPTA
jgi:hypothetical protein